MTYAPATLGRHVCLKWDRHGLFTRDYAGVHARVVGFTTFGNVKLLTEAGDRINARPHQVLDAPQTCQCMGRAYSTAAERSSNGHTYEYDLAAWEAGGKVGLPPHRS